MKTCTNCQKLFTPSSRHACCPKCRNSQKTKFCKCGKLIQNKSECCITCNNQKVRPKKSTLDKLVITTLNRVRRRKKESDLTADYLKTIYNQQKGLCAYTNIPMEMYSSDCSCNNRTFCASLDRIDSNKGYVMGNVQWVIMPINFMKHDFSDLDIKLLIELIKIS